MQLDSLEFALQFAHLLAIGVHEGAFAVGHLHDLVYHQLGVTASIELGHSELNGDAKAVDEAIIPSNVARGLKVEADRVVELIPLGRD
jgi:hypothetical protein